VRRDHDNAAPPLRREPLNPALSGLALLKLKPSLKVPAEPSEAATAPSSAPSVVEVPTAPAGPEDPEIYAAKATWRARKSTLYMRLRKLSPALFTTRAVPLAIGINDEIVRRLELTDVQDLRALGAILHQTVTRHGYLRALGTEGAMRHDLDGNPVEPVSEEHRELAQATLEKLLRKAQVKKQAKK
jgi:hypothetical protein